MRVTKMTPGVVKEIRKQMAEALKKVEDNCGVKITIGKITYGDLNFSAKVEAALINENGRAEVKTRVDFVTLAQQYGLDKQDLDKQVNIRGEQFTIVGLLTKNHRYPIMLQRVRDGGMVKANEREVQTSLLLEHSSQVVS